MLVSSRDIHKVLSFNFLIFLTYFSYIFLMLYLSIQLALLLLTKIHLYILCKHLLFLKLFKYFNTLKADEKLDTVK